MLWKSLKQTISTQPRYGLSHVVWQHWPSGTFLVHIYYLHPLIGTFQVANSYEFLWFIESYLKVTPCYTPHPSTIMSKNWVYLLWQQMSACWLFPFNNYLDLKHDQNSGVVMYTNVLRWPWWNNVQSVISNLLPGSGQLSVNRGISPVIFWGRNRGKSVNPLKQEHD